MVMDIQLSPLPSQARTLGAKLRQTVRIWPVLGLFLGDLA
jgi:hypothetical protein